MYSSRVTTPSWFVSNFSKRFFAPSGSDWRETYSSSVSFPCLSLSSRSNFVARSASAASAGASGLGVAGGVGVVVEEAAGAEGDADFFFASTHQMPLYPGTGDPAERGVAGNVVNAALRSIDRKGQAVKVAEVIADRGIPWHVTRLGARAEYHFMPTAPRDGREQHDHADYELERFLHLYAMNRRILMTPFHNMALMSPATTEADVDRHTAMFASAVDELFG